MSVLPLNEVLGSHFSNCYIKYHNPNMRNECPICSNSDRPVILKFRNLQHKESNLNSRGRNF
jgi:hypothetical protein